MQVYQNKTCAQVCTASTQSARIKCKCLCNSVEQIRNVILLKLLGSLHTPLNTPKRGWTSKWCRYYRLVTGSKHTDVEPSSPNQWIIRCIQLYAEIPTAHPAGHDIQSRESGIRTGGGGGSITRHTSHLGYQSTVHQSVDKWTDEWLAIVHHQSSQTLLPTAQPDLHHPRHPTKVQSHSDIRVSGKNQGSFIYARCPLFSRELNSISTMPLLLVKDGEKLFHENVNSQHKVLSCRCM